jgi:chromosome segregation ATPase
MKYLTLLLACLFVGCAHTAKHYDAPDSTKLRASAGKLAEKVTQAKATAARASAAVSAAKVSTDRETAKLAEITPRVENLLRVSPVELRPEVEALKGEVDELKTDHEETVSHVDAAKSEQSALTAQLEEANAAKNEALKYGSEYFAKVDKQAEDLNAAQVGWAADSKALWKLRSETWMHRILGAVAALLLLGLTIMYFTGKLALSTPKL